MEWTLNLIKSTPEYLEWGWTLSTAVFLVTVALTFLLQLPGLISQARKIWNNRSAEEILPITFVAFTTYFAVFLVYSFSIPSAAGIVNTLVLLMPQAFILAGVAKFRSWGKLDVIAAIAGVLLLAFSFFATEKEVFFSIASIAVFFGLLLQPVEIVRRQSSSNISLWFPLNFAVVTLVWAVYGVVIGNTVLAGASFAFAIVYLSTLYLCFRYRKQ